MSEFFGPYHVLYPLAAGNQSQVDLVENTKAGDRREVLKRISVIPHNDENRDLISAETQGAALQREAHARNPSIIQVYDSGTLNNRFYISMEYVEGRSLAEYLKERGSLLAPLEAASIAREICNQVATLHQFTVTVDGKSHAFLHNDIKPSNIQIRKSDGQLRLIDFGAAKKVTYTKKLAPNDFASVAYCSPERLRDRVSDINSDLWSVGVVLYEMVAGYLPYNASSPLQLEAVIMSGARPAPLPPSCPPALRDIIYKALSIAIADRYPSAPAFAEALQAFCADPQLQTAPPPSPSENPTRRVAPSSGNASGPLPRTSGSAGSRFTTTPSSDRYQPRVRPQRPPRRPLSVPAPILALGRAFARRPLAFTLRAGILALLGYWFILLWWAHGDAQKLYASLDGKDFAAMSVSGLEAATAEVRDLRKHSRGQFFAFTSGLARNIKPRVMEAGERPLVAYRNEQMPSPTAADWLNARSCFNLAAAIDPSDRLVHAELDLTDGHLERLKRHLEDARRKFASASSFAPNSPDPWIGLAYIAAYHDQNFQALIDDQTMEQRAHYTLGTREAAQRGDVLRNMALDAYKASLSWQRKQDAAEETRFLRESDDEFDKAEKSYQGCRNKYHTEAWIGKIHAIRAKIQQRLAELAGASTPENASGSQH